MSDGVAARGRVLIIAGSDSGGGAGIQADIKTVTMLGGFAMTAITAITVQNTLGVRGVHVVPPATVKAQIKAVVDDLGVDAVKIGMLGDRATIEAVAESVAALQVPVVLDPVMVAKGGAALLADDAVELLVAGLLPLATVVTPNLPELEALTRKSLPDAAAMQQAAKALLRQGPKAVLAKGGHLTGPMVEDWLVQQGSAHCFRARRVETLHTHGTGCTLSSAIACGLARGLSLKDAVRQAQLFVQIAIREAPGFGQGHGPMGHAAVRLDMAGANHVALPAADRAASAAFYRKLGFRPLADDLLQGDNGLTLGLGDVARPALYIEYPDLEAKVATLQASGFSFPGGIQAGAHGWREAWCRDPAGNTVCLYQAGVARRFPE